MTEKKKYDSTVARIAGNIVSGLVHRQGLSLGDAKHQRELAIIAVTIARLVIAEVERTEPAHV